MDKSKNSFNLIPHCKILIVTSMFLFLMACTSTGQTATSRSTEAAAALAADAQWYADRYNLTREEATFRLELQEAIGELNANLSEQERETFAGLWIEHEPSYKVIVAFTENGQEILQPYIQDRPYAEFVEVRTHHFSLADLEAAQKQGLAIAETLQLTISGGINVKSNRFTLIVGNPELFLEDVEAAEIALSESIEIAAIDPNNLADTNQGNLFTYMFSNGEPVYFPQQPPREVYPEGDFEGTLILDEQGCLRLGEWEREAPLILWRHDFDLDIEDNKVEILDRTGEEVVQVGQPAKIAGGLSDTVHDIPGMPFARCAGPYLQLGEINVTEGTR